MLIWGRRQASLLLIAAATCSCDDPVAYGDPEFALSPFENCREDEGIQICIQKSTYAPGEMLPFTISNGYSRAAFEDRCSGGVEGRLSDGEEWSGSFGMGRHCGFDVGPEEMLALMRRLEVGILTSDTFSVNPFSYEGEWRVWIRVLNKSGDPIRQTPFVSPVSLVEH